MNSCMRISVRDRVRGGEGGQRGKGGRITRLQRGASRRAGSPARLRPLSSSHGLRPGPWRRVPPLPTLPPLLLLHLNESTSTFYL